MSAEAEFATHWGIGTLLPGDGPADRCGLAGDLAARLPGKPRLFDVYQFLLKNGDDVARCIAHFVEAEEARQARLAARAEPVAGQEPARPGTVFHVRSWHNNVLHLREGGLCLVDPPRALFADWPPMPGDRLIVGPEGWLWMLPRAAFEGGLLPLDQ